MGIKKIGEKILVILAIIAVLIAAGLAGNLDHDEYIEVNSKPVTRMPYYYES